MNRIAHCSQLALLLLLLCGARPCSVGAQARSMTLTVQLRTTERPARPVPHATLTVLDAATRRVVALSSTDATGRAVFALLPIAVRVVVGGQHPNGLPLMLIGQDVDGIWVWLPSHAWLMDLRADTDGAVFPDLASVSAGAPDGADAHALAQGRSVASLPTATLSGTRPVAAPVSVPPDTALIDHTLRAPPWAYLLLVVLTATLVGVVWTSRQRG